MLNSFDQMFMMLSYVVAMKSKDCSTTVGCVVVGSDNEIRSVGYNNFVRGWDDDDPKNHERPYKYEITEHSERNAFYNALRSGVSLKGCKIYVPWHPCCDCARAIVQSGLIEVILHKEYPSDINDKWTDSQQTASDILKQGGVRVRKWSGVIPEITGRLNGKIIYPTRFNNEI